VSWRVNADAALDRWESVQPESRIDAVYEWLLEVAENGPPASAISAPWDEDLLVARIPSVEVVVTFLAIAQDQYVLVKSFDDL